MSPAEVNRLRKIAYAADDAFRVELERVYGKRAGEMRYKREHPHAKVNEAMNAKLAADNAVLRAAELSDELDWLTDTGRFAQ